MPRVARPTSPLVDVIVHRLEGGNLDVVVSFMPRILDAAVLALPANLGFRFLYGGQRLFTNSPNYVQAIARTLGGILCSASRSSKVTLLYWSLDPRGDATELIGELSAADLHKIEISGPSKKNWGRGTRLLPPVKHIVETVAAKSSFIMGIVITDGIIEDIEDVKMYCYKVGEGLVSKGKEKALKLVLIGVGNEIDEVQLQNLNDMFEDTALEGKIDLWATGIAADIQEEDDILLTLFGGGIREMGMFAPSGNVVSNGKLISSYPHGLPERIRFTLPMGSADFTIQVPNHGDIVQDVSEVLIDSMEAVADDSSITEP